jgi:hypothetical protein
MMKETLWGNERLTMVDANNTQKWSIFVWSRDWNPVVSIFRIPGTVWDSVWIWISVCLGPILVSGSFMLTARSKESSMLHAPLACFTQIFCSDYFDDRDANHCKAKASSSRHIILLRLHQFSLCQSITSKHVPHVKPQDASSSVDSYPLSGMGAE